MSRGIPMRRCLIPGSYGEPLAEMNPCHSPKDGKFDHKGACGVAEFEGTQFRGEQATQTARAGRGVTPVIEDPPRQFFASLGMSESQTVAFLNARKDLMNASFSGRPGIEKVTGDRESMAFLSLADGTRFDGISVGNEESVGISDALKTALEEVVQPVISMHTHPGSIGPSLQDVIHLVDCPVPIEVLAVAGRDGSVYAIRVDRKVADDYVSGQVIKEVVNANYQAAHVGAQRRAEQYLRKKTNAPASMNRSQVGHEAIRQGFNPDRVTNMFGRFTRSKVFRAAARTVREMYGPHAMTYVEFTPKARQQWLEAETGLKLS